MRRPDKNVVWDIWMPHLSPSNELLTNYHDKRVDWNEYCIRFNEEVLKKEREYLNILIEMSRSHKVTILCWEKTPKKCHRRLVAEECQRLEPNLTVVIN